jgi:sugar lactone lactonase YvrE
MRVFKFLPAFLLLAGCIANRPTERLEFDAAGAYPEGVAFDASRNVYYVSSARLATVGKVDLQGRYTALYQDSAMRSTYGMKIHPDGKRLFVCTGDANYSKYSTPDTRNKLCRLLILDVESGQKVGEIDLAGLAPGKHYFPNDVVFDKDNNAYVTDSYANVIYKISPEGRASLFSSSELYKTRGIGLNGIVWHPDGFLLASSSATGALYKIPLASPNNPQKVVMPYFFVNGDGLLLDAPDTLTLIQNGGVDKIYKLITKDLWQNAEMAATTLAADRFSYPSTATMRGDEVWVMNAKFHDLEDSTSVPSKRFAIQRAVFKPIPEKLRKE